MKKFFKALLLVVVFAISSCEEDNTVKPEPGTQPEKCRECSDGWD